MGAVLRNLFAVIFFGSFIAFGSMTFVKWLACISTLARAPGLATG